VACAVVTGGAGFIGSHLVDALVGDGWRVVAIDDLSNGHGSSLADEAELAVVDVTDLVALDRVVEAARPRAIFHLAAQGSVTASVADPERDCRVNVIGTLRVLQAAQRHAAPVVLASSGGALYGDAAPIPTPETSIPAPVSPYGASKLAAESYVTTWSRAYGAPHAVCRLANVYGPRQRPDGEAGVVGIFSRRLARGEPPTLFGFGAPTRDYVYVADVVAALIAACGKAGVFNVGTGVATDVATLLALLQAVAGTSIEPQRAPLRPGELMRSCLDPRRARERLGWSARVPLADGLAWTYHSFRKASNLDRVADLTAAVPRA
jgi:UDP-glucose 4-epimerase